MTDSDGNNSEEDTDEDEGLLGDGDLEQCPLAEGSTAPVDEDEEAVKCELPEEEALEMRDGVISAFDRDACSLTPGGSARAEEWLLGSSYDSDDYDTDLEEDFPPEPELPPDNTGKYVYEVICKKQGVTPVSYVIRNIGKGNFRMRYHYLGSNGTAALAQALKKNTVCEEIDLSDNYVEGEGAGALAEMLRENMFVVNLNLSNNFIRNKGAVTLCEMLECNTTLKTLSLQGNQLSDLVAPRISTALQNNMSLGCLDLSHNLFGERGGIFLAAGLAGNIGLSDLDLSWNSIRQKGAVAIGKALGKNSTVEILDLSWNGFGQAGGAAVAAALRVNKFLKVLDLSNNGIGPVAGKKLGLAIGRNKGLETLMIGMNPLGDEGVAALLKGVAANTTLKLVGLEDVSMAAELHVKIKELSESRDIMIMYTGGSPQTSKVNQVIMAVFDRFLNENAGRMEDLFNQMDKDGSGSITLEEFKYGLKDCGLRLTSKQMDTLLDTLDADRSGTVELQELMSGSALVQQEKEKMARAQEEAQFVLHAQH